MPKLPKNMLRIKGKKGYWFQRKAGGRKVRRFLGTDYSEALKRLRSLTKEELPLSDVTVEQATKRWVELYVPNARAEKNQNLIVQRLRDYIVPYLGHYPLRRLSSDHLRLYRVQLERTRLSLQSVKHILSDVRCFLNWCEDSGLVDRSPFPRRIMPRIQERPPDRLTDEEVDRLCGLPDPYGFVCRLLVQTGLRWGEAERAQSADIQNGVLVVHQTKSRKVRRVPLPTALREEVRLRVGKLIPFRSQQWLTDYCRRETEIEGFHVHQFRHSFACRWLEDGGSLAALQEILGHASIVTTQRYARLGETHVLDEARRVEGRRDTKGATRELRQSS